MAAIFLCRQQTALVDVQSLLAMVTGDYDGPLPFLYFTHIFFPSFHIRFSGIVCMYECTSIKAHLFDLHSFVSVIIFNSLLPQFLKIYTNYIKTFRFDREQSAVAVHHAAHMKMKMLIDTTMEFWWKKKTHSH